MYKISIVVPVYNVQKYLNKCLDSIINQTYKNLEIILVNDGSTDLSYNICKEYAQKDERIVLINKQNGGLSSAVYTGIEASTGEFIGFVDSDDWIDKNFYQKLVDCQILFSADIVISGHTEIYESTLKEIKRNELEEGLWTSVKLVNFKENVFNDDCKDIIKYYCRWNKLFKSDLIKNNIKFINFNVTMGEDWLLVLPTIIDASTIAFAKENLYYYNVRHGSISRKSEKEVVDRFLSLRDSLVNILLEKKLYSENKQNNIARDVLYLAIKYICYNVKELKKAKAILLELYDKYKIVKINQFTDKNQSKIIKLFYKKKMFRLSLLIKIYKLIKGDR